MSCKQQFFLLVKKTHLQTIEIQIQNYTKHNTHISCVIWDFKTPSFYI
jgi:hypothetical protein